MKVWLSYTLFCFLLIIASRASAGVIDSMLQANNHPTNEQVEELYNNQLRYNKDSAYVLHQLNNLVAFAEKKDDEQLLSLSNTILADHYARLRQFNLLSTQLHQKAVSIAQQNNLPLAEGMAVYKLGRYYYSFKHYSLAFEQLLKAKIIFENIGIDKVPAITDFYFYMGSLYREIGDHDEALAYFQKINNQSTNHHKQHWFAINTFDNIALIYQKKKQYDSAIAYFQKTADAAKKFNYPDWEGLCMGNIGKLYFEQGHQEKAYPYLQAGAIICQQLKDYESASGYRYIMMLYHIARHETAAAETIFGLMDTAYEHKSSAEVKMQYYHAKALVQEAKGNTAQALQSWKAYNTYKDSTDRLYDEKQLHDIQVRLETNAHLSKLHEVEAASRNRLLVRNILLITAAILGLMAVLLYFRERSRRKLEKDLFAKRQQLLNEQKQRANDELATAKTSLQKFTENIREKNELIQQIHTEIETLKQEQELGLDQQTKLTFQLQQKTILTPNEWHEFKLLFNKVHPGFFVKLKDSYPQFTQSEVRLLALMKLKMESTDMGAMLGISVDSVKKTKQRLRKKLTDLGSTTYLEDFVMQVA